MVCTWWGIRSVGAIIISLLTSELLFCVSGSTGGYCEVCDETVNSIKSHEKTNRHVTKKAEKEGRELYMHHCQIDNCGKAFVRLASSYNSHITRLDKGPIFLYFCSMRSVIISFVVACQQCLSFEHY